jgi:hypothetical protein
MHTVQTGTGRRDKQLTVDLYEYNYWHLLWHKLIGWVFTTTVFYS